MSKEDEIETKTYKFKGKGKYLLKYNRTVIKERGNDDEGKVTIVSFDDKTIPVNEQATVSDQIELIDTDNPFLVAKPKDGEAIIVRKPSKIDIFVSDLELAKDITALLNRIKEGWTSSPWCTDSEPIKVSAMIKMGKGVNEEEISQKIILFVDGIIPCIEKVMEKSYGDEK